MLEVVPVKKKWWLERGGGAFMVCLPNFSRALSSELVKELSIDDIYRAMAEKPLDQNPPYETNAFHMRYYTLHQEPGPWQNNSVPAKEMPVSSSAISVLWKVFNL